MMSCCANIDRVNKFVVHYRGVKMDLHMEIMKARFSLNFLIILMLTQKVTLLVEFLFFFFWWFIELPD